MHGFRDTIFITPQGEIRIAFPVYVKAGAVLTGRVLLDPAGKTDEEKKVIVDKGKAKVEGSAE